MLPEIAALGFDVVYLPPVHPIGETYRKGRNNTRARGRATPAARGRSAVRRGWSRLPFTRTSVRGRLRARWWRQRATPGIEIALDFAIQCSPDHPWLQRAPGMVPPPPRRDDQVRREPAEALPGHSQRRLGLQDGRGALAGAPRRRAGWCERGVLVFRVDNPHTKPMPFWEWLIARRPASHPEAIFLSEAFTRPAPMTTLAKIGFSQPTRTSRGRTRRPSWSSTRRAGAQLSRRSTGRTSWPNTPTSSTSTSGGAGGPRSRRGSCSRRRSRRATASTPVTRLREHPGPRGQRGVPRLREVRGQAARAAGAAATADPPPERVSGGPIPHYSGTRASPGSIRTARSRCVREAGGRGCRPHRGQPRSRSCPGGSLHRAPRSRPARRLHRGRPPLRHGVPVAHRQELRRATSRRSPRDHGRAPRRGGGTA